MKKWIIPLILCLLLLIPTAMAAGPNGTVAVSIFNQSQRVYDLSNADVVRLTLNGAPLEGGGVPALVWQGRTMVPVRLVAENLGVVVHWSEVTEQVILRQGENTVVLTLGSPSALVNGQEVPLPDGVPATVVKYGQDERTMVPVRFVTEQLGGSVHWDQNTFEAALLSLPKQQGGRVVDISVDSHAQTVFIATDYDPEFSVLDLGDRVAVDMPGATLATDMPGRIAVDNELISAVRFAGHDASLYSDYESTVRVVLDLQPDITLRENIRIEKVDGGILLTTFLPEREEYEYVPTVPLDPNKKTVVLDAGHGGARIGAFYEGIAEKDINLSVTKKVETILRAHGYNVVMTRDEDVEIGLYERADIANAVQADVFVSIHSNALENNVTFEGLLVYYHPTSNRGARLARSILTPMVRLTGGIDRGIRSADLVVVRETEMCAVLVEMGFMSTHDELMRLIDDSYQNKLAQGIAEGVVKYLNGVS